MQNKRRIAQSVDRTAQYSCRYRLTAVSRHVSSTTLPLYS